MLSENKLDMINEDQQCQHINTLLDQQPFAKSIFLHFVHFYNFVNKLGAMWYKIDMKIGKSLKSL